MTDDDRFEKRDEEDQLILFLWTPSPRRQPNKTASQVPNSGYAELSDIRGGLAHVRRARVCIVHLFVAPMHVVRHVWRHTSGFGPDSEEMFPWATRFLPFPAVQELSCSLKPAGNGLLRCSGARSAPVSPGHGGLRPLRPDVQAPDHAGFGFSRRSCANRRML